MRGEAMSKHCPHPKARPTLSSWLAVAILVLLAPLLVQPPSAGAAPSSVTIVIIHGLPKFTADVYVNGKLLLDGFKPEAVTAPLKLPSGTYHIAIRNVGAPPDSTPAVQGDITLQAGKNYTAAAHLT